VDFVAGAGPAELFQLNLARRGLFVFGGAIVLSLALGALEMDNVAHGAAP
jgi:hypothetical protein